MQGCHSEACMTGTACLQNVAVEIENLTKMIEPRQEPRTTTVLNCQAGHVLRRDRMKDIVRHSRR